MQMRCAGEERTPRAPAKGGFGWPSGSARPTGRGAGCRGRAREVGGNTGCDGGRGAAPSGSNAPRAVARARAAGAGTASGRDRSGRHARRARRHLRTRLRRTRPRAACGLRRPDARDRHHAGRSDRRRGGRVGHRHLRGLCRSASSSGLFAVWCSAGASGISARSARSSAASPRRYSKGSRTA